MKRLFALLLAMILIISSCGCAQSKKTVLVISGAEIDNEIFTYYLDKVISRPADYGLSEKPEKDEAKAAAIEKCREYVAVNTIFGNLDLSLSVSDKVGVSETVNNLWVRFENHYDEIGVSKQTLTKIYTSQAYAQAVFDSVYDKGVDDAQAEAVIQNYFYDNYVCFRAVCEYFYTADGKQISQKERTELLARFDGIAAASANGADGFSAAVQTLGYSASASVILKKDSDGYPEGFYDKVYAMKDNSVEIIIYDDCVFAVMKESLKDKGESVYSEYRSSCIEDLYSDESRLEIEEMMESFDIEEKGSAADKIIRNMM